MSRRQLYRTGRSNNIPYGPDTDRHVVHWKFGTVEQAIKDAGADDEEPRIHKYTVRTWVVDKDVYKPVEDGDKEDRVTFKVTERPVVAVVETTPSELSASDIRGAVGGEAIPGIASETHRPEANGDSIGPVEVDIKEEASIEPSVEPDTGSVEPGAVLGAGSLAGPTDERPTAEPTPMSNDDAPMETKVEVEETTPGDDTTRSLDIEMKDAE